MPTDDAASDASNTAPDASPHMAAASPSTPGLAEGLAVLDRLAERPLHEHAEAYHGLHTDLQAALAEIDGA
jgi:hypothetical protein